MAPVEFLEMNELSMHVVVGVLTVLFRCFPKTRERTVVLGVVCFFVRERKSIRKCPSLLASGKGYVDRGSRPIWV